MLSFGIASTLRMSNVHQIRMFHNNWIINAIYGSANMSAPHAQIWLMISHYNTTKRSPNFACGWTLFKMSYKAHMTRDQTDMHQWCAMQHCANVSTAETWCAEMCICCKSVKQLWCSNLTSHSTGEGNNQCQSYNHYFDHMHKGFCFIWAELPNPATTTS